MIHLPRLPSPPPPWRFEGFFRTYLDDDVTQAERLKVREALLELGEELWSFISTQGWDLHRLPHRQLRNEKFRESSLTAAVM